MTTSRPLQQSDLPLTESDRTFSAEDFPVRTSALLAKAQDSQANAQGYGENTPVLLAKYDPASQSWKTSQLCLDGDLAEFSETCPRSGMMQSGTAYQLPTLALLTDATDSGLWRTPTAHDWKNTGHCSQTYLSDQVRPHQVKNPRKAMWPTPNANDNRDRGNLSSPCVQRRARIGKQLMLSQVVSDKSGALNPTWVEWLMGFPLEWTALNPSETQSFRKSPKSSGKQS